MSAASIAVAPAAAGSARRALHDMGPIAAAVVPFGTVVGVTLDRAGLIGPAALIATALLYAGSSQLAALSVLIAGGGPLAAVFAGAIVNVRMLLYSAGLSARFRQQPQWFRWVAPLTTVDQTFALATGADDLDDQEFRRYWVTIGAVLGTVWLAAVGTGMALGSILPARSPMDIAVPATLVALLAPRLGSARMRSVALTAAAVAVVGQVLPAGLGIVAAILVGLVVAGPSHADGRRVPPARTSTGHGRTHDPLRTGTRLRTEELLR